MVKRYHTSVNILNIYQPSRSLRSSSLKYLSVPKCNTVSYGHRAFSVASAKLWNSLPYYLRFTENISTFKTSLKAFLFKVPLKRKNFFAFFYCSELMKHHWKKDFDEKMFLLCFLRFKMLNFPRSKGHVTGPRDVRSCVVILL